MGSCDSFMIAASGLVTRNCHRPLFPNRSDRHHLFVARMAALLVVVGGVLYAYSLEGVIRGGPENPWKINTMTGPAFWLGLFRQRTTVAGAWAATACTVSTRRVTTRMFAIEWLASLPVNDSLQLVVASYRRRPPLCPARPAQLSYDHPRWSTARPPNR